MPDAAMGTIAYPDRQTGMREHEHKPTNFGQIEVIANEVKDSLAALNDDVDTLADLVSGRPPRVAETLNGPQEAEPSDRMERTRDRLADALAQISRTRTTLAALKNRF